jgi:hypothetical protein
MEFSSNVFSSEEIQIGGSGSKQLQITIILCLLCSCIILCSTVVVLNGSDFGTLFESPITGLLSCTTCIMVVIALIAYSMVSGCEELKDVRPYGWSAVTAATMDKGQTASVPV